MLVLTPVVDKKTNMAFCEVRRTAYNGDPDALRKEIGCEWLEAVHIGKGLDLWLDECGKLGTPKPYNSMATRLYGRDTIVGTACVLSHDGEGNEADLTDEEERVVLGWLGVDGDFVKTA